MRHPTPDEYAEVLRAWRVAQIAQREAEAAQATANAAFLGLLDKCAVLGAVASLGLLEGAPRWLDAAGSALALTGGNTVVGNASATASGTVNLGAGGGEA